MMRIILIGGNETVYFLARDLKRKNHYLTIINRDEYHCQELFRHTDATVIHGEGTDPATLEEAGVRMTDVVLALTPHDQDNLVACQLAAKVYGVPRTIALVNDPENEEIFQQLGVTDAFSSTQIIAKMIEQRASFADITRLMPVGDGHIHVADVKLDKESPVVGKSLLEVELSEHTLVACILRDDEVIIPRGGNRLQVNDHLVLISKPGYEEADIEIITGEKP